MVDVNVGTNRKLRRLTPPERWCHVAGVLAIAAQSPIRGRLLIGDETPIPRDFAEQAGVTVATAQTTLKKLRDLGVIEPDEDNDCEQIHDWEELNPSPKRDSTAAERMKRYRERRNSRNGNATVTERNAVTVTAGREVEEKRREEKNNNGGAKAPVEPGSTRAEEDEDFAYWQELTGHHQAKFLDERRKMYRARRGEGYTREQCRRGIEGSATPDAVGKDGTLYDDFRNIFRNGANLEMYIGFAEKHVEDTPAALAARMRERASA
jgi:DNA-binding transcriptional regulator YhcF (GntR family)